MTCLTCNPNSVCPKLNSPAGHGRAPLTPPGPSAGFAYALLLWSPFPTSAPVLLGQRAVQRLWKPLSCMCTGPEVPRDLNPQSGASLTTNWQMQEYKYSRSHTHNRDPSEVWPTLPSGLSCRSEPPLPWTPLLTTWLLGLLLFPTLCSHLSTSFSWDHFLTKHCMNPAQKKPLLPKPAPPVSDLKMKPLHIQWCKQRPRPILPFFSS